MSDVIRFEVLGEPVEHDLGNMVLFADYYDLKAENERLRAALNEAVFGHKMWEGIYGSSPESRAHLVKLEAALRD